MGIDCGNAIVGWAVLDASGNSFKHVASGAVTTTKNDSSSLRLKQVFDAMRELISEYNPEQVAVEQIYFFKNQKTVIPVAQARGVIVLAAAIANLPVFDYTPIQVKLAVTGYGRAEKKQVQFMVSKLLKLKQIPRLDDVADAIAVGFCHLTQTNAKYH